MDLNAMDQYWIWLSSIDGIGPKRFYHLISIYEDARTVWDMVGDENMKFLGAGVLRKLKECKSERYFYELFAKIEKSGVKPITRLNPDYPDMLNNIYDPPPALYALGDADLNDEKMIAIVGSRRCTRDGKRAASEIAETLAREDVTVVSGMAHGIDTAAHEGALIGMGKTIAVLGCGTDVIYPIENEALYHRILENGAYPVLSGWDILEHYRWAARPDAENAAPRNKIELDPEDDMIVRPLLEQELSFDELANIVDFPIAKLNSHLTMLELRGIIVKVPGGLYRAYL